MSAKRIVLTLLDHDEALGQSLYKTATGYGLAASGHFWVDDVDKAAFAGPMGEVAAPETTLWLIAGKRESFGRESVRRGLSLAALGVLARRGGGFPICVLGVDGPLDPAGLPAPFAGAAVLELSAALGPKLVAKANVPVPKIEPGYRLDVHSLPGIGLFFEVGPGKDGAWAGAVFGVEGGEIDVHGVGPAGVVPERCVVEYPMKGLKFGLGGSEFVAWGVKNALDASTSYFVRVKGAPKALAFGPFPDAEDAELHRLVLA